MCSWMALWLASEHVGRSFAHEREGTIDGGLSDQEAGSWGERVEGGTCDHCNSTSDLQTPPETPECKNSTAGHKGLSSVEGLLEKEGGGHLPGLGEGLHPPGGGPRVALGQAGGDASQAGRADAEPVGRLAVHLPAPRAPEDQPRDLRDHDGHAGGAVRV